MPRARSLLVVALGLGCACAREPERASRVRPQRERQAEREPRPSHPAVGSLVGLPAELAASFADTPHFAPLRPPGPDDWLASHKEPGQTVGQYVANSPVVPSPERHTIYILPIGPFPEVAPSFDTFEGYAEAFFQLDVAILDPIEVESLAASAREWDYGPQLDTEEVLVALERLLPTDAFLLIGLTMTDLYPGEDWNFVFGYASLEKRVGVYSLLRFDPLVVDPRRSVTLEQRRALMLRRGLKLMTHELTHSFGMRHCIHYECLMNGSNHIAETDAHPMHLCPVCLRKLQLATDFDPVARYEQLGEFFGGHGLDQEAAWIRARLGYLAAAQ